MFKTSFYHKYAYKLLYLCILILSTAFVFCIAVTNPGIQTYYKSYIFNMVDGTAFRPFVYRLLLPYIANKIILSIPEKTSSAIAQLTMSHTTLKSFFSDRNWSIDYASEYYVVLILMYASLWGFVFSFRYFFRAVFKTSERFIDAVSLLTILGLPCLYRYNTYLYDFTTLFLFTLGLAMMIRRRWISYLFVFVFACLNKETTILLTCIYTIHFFKHQKLNSSTYTFILLIQIGIYISIKTFIDTLFIHNQGVFLEFWLKRNINFLLQPYPIFTYLQWLILGFLVIYKWSEKPLFLKQGLLILIPLLGSTLIWGWIDELRDYYEVYPIVILLISYSMARILQVSIYTARSPLTDNQPEPATDVSSKVQVTT